MRLPRLFAGQELIRERDNALRSLKRVQEELNVATERLTELAWRPHLYYRNGAVYAKGFLTSQFIVRQRPIGQENAHVQGSRLTQGITSVLNTQWVDAPSDVRSACSAFEDRLRWKELREVKEPW